MREIFGKEIEFLTPDVALEELENYITLISRKADIPKQRVQQLLNMLLEKVQIIPRREYQSFMKEAKELVKDSCDEEFLAAAIASGADAIWTHDKHFFEQQRIKIVTNQDLL